MLSTLVGAVALLLLFLKLPGVPEFIGLLGCKSCSTTTPYLPMLAASYFAAFITCILSFPSFPSRSLKRGGLVWALGLAITLTYLSPSWCFICLIAHGCHLAMWLFWKPIQTRRERQVGMKLSLIFTSSLAMMALFSTLNFTFLIYGLKIKKPTLVKAGTRVKPLESVDFSQFAGVVLNFVSEHCPYCEKQAPLLETVVSHFPDIRIFTVNRRSHADLFELFGIEGYPTMVLIDPKGIVVKTVAGLPNNFEKEVTKELATLTR